MACGTPPKCFGLGIELAHVCSLRTCPPKTKSEYSGEGHPFLSKMQFSEGTLFLKSTQMALESSKSDIFLKMTRIGPRICLKVPCVQIWPTHSKRKCPKWPIVICHALYYKVFLVFTNLNHLKSETFEFNINFPLEPVTVKYLKCTLRYSNVSSTNHQWHWTLIIMGGETWQGMEFDWLISIRLCLLEGNSLF